MAKKVVPPRQAPEPAQGNPDSAAGNNWLAKFVAALIAVLLVLIVMSTNGSSNFFEALKNPDYARGVIMFLVSMTAVLLSFIVVFFSFFGELDDAEKSEIRFRRAREIFVAMMGVLGTIIGFYFGQSDKNVPADQLAKPAIEIVDDKAVVHLANGFPPFQYVVKFSKSTESRIAETSDKEWITFPFPGEEKEAFTIEIEDIRGKTASAEFKP